MWLLWYYCAIYLLLNFGLWLVLVCFLKIPLQWLYLHRSMLLSCYLFCSVLVAFWSAASNSPLWLIFCCVLYFWLYFVIFAVFFIYFISPLMWLAHTNTLYLSDLWSLFSILLKFVCASMGSGFYTNLSIFCYQCYHDTALKVRKLKALVLCLSVTLWPSVWTGTSLLWNYICYERDLMISLTVAAKFKSC